MFGRTCSMFYETCARISGSDFSSLASATIHNLTPLLEQSLATGVTAHGELRYMISRFSNIAPGSFRVRPKIHKCPVGMRPVANPSNAWNQPLASFMCDLLRPVLSKVCTHIVASSDDVFAMLPHNSKLVIYMVSHLICNVVHTRTLHITGFVL